MNIENNEFINTTLKSFIDAWGFTDTQLFKKIKNFIEFGRFDIPIYITGVKEHQGKGELKQLLQIAGFRNVYQRNDMYNADIYNVLLGEDETKVDKLARELFNLVGFVIDFGDFYLPEYNTK